MPVPTDDTAYLAAHADAEAKWQIVKAAAVAYNQAVADWNSARYLAETEATALGGTPFPGA